jgi:pimeloyl-ACP methyl ester carboxylesterase
LILAVGQQGNIMRLNINRFKKLSALSLLAMLTGCYYLQSNSIPIGTMEYKNLAVGGSNKSGRQLMVLLPGIGDRASVFDKYSVIDTIHKKNPNMDIVAVDAHFKYYEARTIVERLRADIIKPAIAAGYRKIYLGGTSLGGFGSLLYLKQYPDDLTKIFIIAPYLGDEQDYEYLLENLAPPIPLRDVNIWPWITLFPPELKDKIYLAYGADDKFAIPNKLLSKYLVEDHVFTQEGRHNWKTWAKLWPRLAEKM